MLHGRGAGRRTSPPLPGPETEQTTAREKREKSVEKIRGSYRKTIEKKQNSIVRFVKSQAETKAIHLLSTLRKIKS